MNWIRPTKRLAIYLRDGLACVYCGAGVETDVKLTLDHVRCHRDGGNNDAANLVTACLRCNSVRGSRSLRQFAGAAAAYLNHGLTAATITAHVRAPARRSLDLALASELMTRRRGGVAAAMQHARARAACRIRGQR